MSFNKKLIAVAVVFACASSVIAMDQQLKDASSASRGYTITIPTNFAELSEMLTAGKNKLVSYGSETTGQARDAVSARALSVLRWGASKGSSLYSTVDVYAGNRITRIFKYMDSTLTDSSYIGGYYAPVKGRMVSIIDPLFKQD